MNENFHQFAKGSHKTLTDQVKRHPNKAENYVLVQDTNGNLWRKYQTILTDEHHLHHLQNMANWRSSTSLPILKAKSLDVQQKPTFPKNCTLLVEHLVADFSQLQNLSFGESLYLLKECLLGFQAIIYKFGCVIVLRQNCGVNKKGQCRVWRESGLGTFFEDVRGMEDMKKVTENMIEILIKIIKPSELFHLQQLKQFFQTEGLYNFYEIYQNIQVIAQRKNIQIPTCLIIEKKQEKMVKRPPKKARYSFNYNLESRSFINQSDILLNSSIKPKIFWRYSNIQTTPASCKSIKNINHEIPIKGKSLSNIRSQYSFRQYDITKQYSIVIPPSVRGIATTKNSLSTTHITNSKNQSSFRKSHNEKSFQQQTNVCDLKLHSNRNVVSVMLESFKAEDLIHGKYNFGGLLPTETIEQREQNQETIFDLQRDISKNTFSLKESKLTGRKLQRLTYSIEIDPCEESQKDQQYEDDVLRRNSWSKKFNCLLEEDIEDLKESICYEEEHEELNEIQIKLEKLGRFGRQIGKSIIPYQK